MAGPVLVCEVGPRDGLQGRAAPLPVAERVALLERLADAGLARIEAVSFVRDDRVPAMAGAEAVLAGVRRRPGLELAGLVMNARGAERAAACDLHEVRFVVVASDALSMRNQGADVDATLRAFATVAAIAARAGRRVAVVIAAAFGCPYEGPVPRSRVVEIAGRVARAGADEVVLADTIGAAAPPEVEARVVAVRDAAGGRPVGVHLHNTRNAGYANAYAALRAGATVFDAAIGGLGGCPFAPRATGNVATEDLVWLLEGCGVRPLPDLGRLIEVNAWLADRLGEPLPGLLARAGPFPSAAAPGTTGAAPAVPASAGAASGGAASAAAGHGSDDGALARAAR